MDEKQALTGRVGEASNWNVADASDETPNIQPPPSGDLGVKKVSRKRKRSRSKKEAKHG